MTTYKKQSGPGKAYRRGLTDDQLTEMFSTEKKAEKWFQDHIWKGTPKCPQCGSTNVNLKIKHPTMPYRCRERECRKYFSIRTGTIMEDSKISLRHWALTTHHYNTNLDGISSMRLHRKLGITQRSAWFMLHRLRKASAPDKMKFEGTVEVDETFLGGKVRMMSNATKKRLKAEYGENLQGGKGKDILIGIKERETKQFQVDIIPDRKPETLKKFVLEHTIEGTTVITDEADGYKGLDKLGRIHKSVNHSKKEWVKKDDREVHIQGIESYWFTVKAGGLGAYRRVSKKHRLAYAWETTGKRNLREFDTLDQMGALAYKMKGKRLKYRELTKGDQA